MEIATEISDIKSDLFNDVRCILQVMPQKESLSDYVRRVMNDQGFTYRQVEARSGGSITGGYVNDIVQKKTTNPSIEKLQALAKGLGRPEDEVMSVARGYKKPSEDQDFTESVYFMLYKKHKTAEPQTQEFASRVLAMLERELDRSPSKNKPSKAVTLPVTSPANIVYAKDGNKRTGEK